MTPELEAKAREFLAEIGYKVPEGDWISDSVVHAAAKFAASQLSIERKWWIERIEQERDRWDEADNFGRKDEYWLLDDLLTSVRERGGK